MKKYFDKMSYEIDIDIKIDPEDINFENNNVKQNKDKTSEKDKNWKK